jgi:hypothetical protein
VPRKAVPSGPELRSSRPASNTTNGTGTLSARPPGRACNRRAARRVQPRVKVSYLVAVASLAGVAACGSQAAGQPAGPPSAATAPAIPARTVTASPAGSATASRQAVIPQPGSPPPTLTGLATLTIADNGATVRMRPGQRVTAVLTAQGLFSWHVPAAAGAAVKRAGASGGYPGLQPARAVFLAVQPGTATLTALDDTACLHAQPACEPAQQVWRVTVIVTGIYPAP